MLGKNTTLLFFLSGQFCTLHLFCICVFCCFPFVFLFFVLPSSIVLFLGCTYLNLRLWCSILSGIHRCLGNMSPEEDSRGALFFFWLSKDIISPRPHPSAPAARKKGRKSTAASRAKLICLSGTVSIVCVCVCVSFFSSRLWLTRKVEITNAWALCLGGLAKKEQKKTKQNKTHKLRKKKLR